MNIMPPTDSLTRLVERSDVRSELLNYFDRLKTEGWEPVWGEPVVWSFVSGVPIAMMKVYVGEGVRFIDADDQILDVTIPSELAARAFAAKCQCFGVRLWGVGEPIPLQ